MNLKEFIISMLKDEQGNISSKRIVGVIGALSLICIMIIYHNENLISNVLILVLSCLGLSSVDKITNKDNKNQKDEENE
jgi:hypothetical protein